MESVLNLCINIQMFSVTDCNGTIHPVQFKFRDNSGEIITVRIQDVECTNQTTNNLNIIFNCTAVICDTLKRFELRYNTMQHKWYLSKMQFIN